jgi:DDE domain
LKQHQGRLGDSWHLDEVFIRINGQQHYLWRAVDQDGGVIDIPYGLKTRQSVSSSTYVDVSGDVKRQNGTLPTAKPDLDLLGRLQNMCSEGCVASTDFELFGHLVEVLERPPMRRFSTSTG